ncbi:MAG: hypothetical protein AAB439_03670 [Patescibacteria group bacterium]
MFKRMMMKALMAKQLKGMPKEMQEQVISMVEKNPEFFTSMAKKIQERVKRGENQMMAMQAVAKENQAELQKMFRGE